METAGLYEMLEPVNKTIVSQHRMKSIPFGRTALQIVTEELYYGFGITLKNSIVTISLI
jgi:hypothetical protein